MNQKLFYDYVIEAMFLVNKYENKFGIICPFRDIIEGLITQLGISNNIEAEEVSNIISEAEDVVNNCLRSIGNYEGFL